MPLGKVAFGVKGSSPRMRGARGEGGKGARLLGIIPAYAGSTNLKHLVGLDFGDHPRVCGEHKYKGEFLYKVKGSSPRMRGAQLVELVQEHVFGIIPAYAGSTARHPLPCTAVWDHPRVCGEHIWPLPVTFGVRGSSPRMRGALDHIECEIHDVRIIPAYAGSTSTRSTRTSTRRDHPRVCGEHPRNALRASPLMGSSPRMRGALFRLHAIRVA